MSKHGGISVSNLSFYAENPEAFCKAGGRPYNEAAARIGTKRHNSVGRLPSKVLFILITAAIIAAYLYLAK